MCLLKAKAQLRVVKEDIEHLELGDWDELKDEAADGMEVWTFEKELDYLKNGKGGWQKMFEGLGLFSKHLKPKSPADFVASIALTELFGQMLDKGKK